MQKYTKPYINTGAFAKLCGTNKRTLIHYEEIGLFSPAYTDDRGYRYYSETQCDVFSIITALKEIGMPLSQIKDYLDTRHPDALADLLTTQHQRIKQEIANLNRLDLMIQTKLSLVAQSKKVTVNTVTLEYCEEEYLVISPHIDSNEHEKVLHTLYNHLAFCNTHKLNIGHPYGAMIRTAHLIQKAYDIYAYFFIKVLTPPASVPCYTKPEGRYLTTYLQGDYYNSETSYTMLLDYASSHNLVLGDYSFKEAIIDEVAEKSIDNYITKISIPVQTP